jgi:hypothetical protein
MPWSQAQSRSRTRAGPSCPVSLNSREARGRLTGACALARCGWGRQVEKRGWAYRRRQPEGTVLYEVVRDNLATLLAEASEVGGPAAVCGAGLRQVPEVRSAGARGCATPEHVVLSPKPSRCLRSPGPCCLPPRRACAPSGCTASPPARRTARVSPVRGPPRPLCTSPPLNRTPIRLMLRLPRFRTGQSQDERSKWREGPNEREHYPRLRPYAMQLRALPSYPEQGVLRRWWRCFLE